MDDALANERLTEAARGAGAGTSAGRGPLALVGVLVTLCCALLAPARATAAAAKAVYLPLVMVHPAPTPTPDPCAAIERRLAALINQERADEGLPPLALADALSRAARGHSLDMATNGFFGHEGSDGSSPGARISAAGYAWRSLGENIAAGYASPEEVVAAWMDSPGHRQAMLESSYRDIGVGYVYRIGSPYWYYWTADFASR